MTGAEGDARPGGGFRWSLPLGRVAGIPIRVHVTFLLLVALIVVAGGAGTGAELAGSVVWIDAVFGCVLLHELSHCVVARRYGVVVKDVLLLPIGGLSEMEQLPSEPRQELAIAAAGPAASIVLGVLALAGAGVVGPAPWPPALVAGSWVARLGWLNVLLAGFNLLPALPLDGGRMLRAALALRWGRSRATDMAVALARSTAALLVVAGVFYDVWLAFIGAFVFLAATQEGREDKIHRALRGRTVRDAMTWRRPGPVEVDWRSEPLGLDGDLDEAVDRLVRSRPRALPVVGPEGSVVGVLSLSDVEKWLTGPDGAGRRRPGAGTRGEWPGAA